MRKTFTILSLTGFLLILCGCEQKPLYPKKKQETTGTPQSSPTVQQPVNKTPQPEPVKENKKSDVGVADFADYATGTTQLKTKQFAKKRLTNAYGERKENLEEAAKDKK